MIIIILFVMELHTTDLKYKDESDKDIRLDRMTTMALHKSVQSRFRVFKLHPRESDESCLVRILSQLESLEEDD